MYGILGFVGFEGLKIYKRIWGGKRPLPKCNLYAYFIMIIVIATFSGFVSVLFSKGNLAEALFIGFSIPSSCKAIIEPIRKKNHNRSVDIDDIDLAPTSFLTRVQRLFGNLFSF